MKFTTGIQLLFASFLLILLWAFSSSYLPKGEYFPLLAEANPPAGCAASDTLPPQALCQNIQVFLDANGQYALTAAEVDAGSSDNCGIQSMSVQPSLIDCQMLGQASTALIVTDSTGLADTCYAVLTVTDTLPPSVTCPAPLSLVVDANCQAAVPDFTPLPGNILASSTADFSDVQGQGNWEYGSYAAWDYQNFTQLPNFNNVWYGTQSDSTPLIGPSAMMAGADDLAWAVRRWTSDFTGQISISGAYYDIDNNCAADSLKVRILQNGNPIFADENVSSTSTPYSVSTFVQTGDLLDFVIDPDSVAHCDTAYFSATIQVVSLLQVSDNCTDLILTQMPAAGTLVGAGEHEIAIVAHDLSGNTDTCTLLFTALDTLPPTALCQNATVSLDANGQYQLSPNEIDGGSSDNCGIDTMYVSPTAFDCSHRGTPQTVNLHILDAAGLADSCTATVTVQDTTAPNALCRDTVWLTLDANGQTTLSAGQINDNSTDNCEVFSMSVSPNSFDCQNTGANTAILSVSDLVGNTGTCQTTVVVSDSLAPLAACVDVNLYLDANGSAVLSGLQLGPNSSDNCALLSLLASPSAYDCSDVGGQPVTATLTATDIYGNSSTCTGNVTVLDTVAPTAVCQNITVALDANGQYQLSPNEIDGGSSDACGLASLSAQPNSFDCQNTGANAVTLTVTDNSGNSSTCTATVTVQDTTNPTAICQDLAVALDANGQYQLSPNEIDGGSSDACGLASLSAQPNSFDCQNTGANIVTLTATDNSGNTSTCTATVTVQDTTNPAAVCQNITVQLDANGEVSIIAQQVDGGSADACGIVGLAVSPGSFNCQHVGDNAVVLTVTDSHGNTSTCTATVTVEDQVPPQALCQDISVQLDANGQASITAAQIDNGSSDACGIAALTVMPGSFDCQNTGANTVTLFVTDMNGNSDFCTATVSVVDAVAPEMQCQNIEVFLDAGGAVNITPQMIDAGSADACTAVSLSVSPTNFQCTEVGLNAVTLTGTDAYGNQASCNALVTVTDTVPPTALCHGTTVYLGTNGEASLSPAQIDGGSSDACGIAQMQVNKPLLYCDDLGGNNVLLIVTDNNGNESACVAVVEVEDPIPPVAVCQNASINLGPDGTAILDPALLDGGSSDNCGGWTLSVNKSDYDCSQVGVQPVIMTITDAFGNTASCSAQLSVVASAICPPPAIDYAGGPNISDPCTCRGNGEFDEEVVIGPTGQGLNWTVSSTTLLDPNTLQPYPAGTVFTEVMVGGGQSIYTLQGVHLDGQGYTLSAVSAFYPGVVLQISNTCYYPQPQITGLDGPFCLYSPSVELSGEANGALLVDSFFTINGNPATIFDPFQLGVGVHTVEYTVDAGAAGPGDPTDPGCVASTQQQVVIQTTPTGMSCNNSVNVGIDGNCEALITPDMVLEGTYGCYDDYSVSIFSGVNQIGNPITGQYIGQNLTVQITHLVSGNSCWGTLVVYDNLAPVIDCAAADTVAISCTQQVGDVPPPPAYDNCTPVDVSLTEELLIDDDACDDGVARYRRTWIAVDTYGNQSDPCEQIIEIVRPDDVDFPNDIIWTCDQYDSYPNITAAESLHPSIAALQNSILPIDATGVTTDAWLSNTGSGLPEGIQGTYCAYSHAYSDQVLQGCGNSFTIVRTWAVLDWCTGQLVTGNAAGEDDEQIIQVVDITPPDVQIAPFSVSANISGSGSQVCTSEDYLFPPTVSDNCNGWTVSIFTPIGEAIYLNGTDGSQGGLIPPPGLPLGMHTITYVAIDDCGNTTTVNVDIEVVDDISPVTICDEITTISLPTDGQSLTPAEVFDDGSLDNCCLDEFLVKRTTDACDITGNTTFGPSVIFCCADVDAGPVEVTMRAVDCAGNYNDCTVYVYVEDNAAPQLLFCPDDVNILCDTYLDELAPALAQGDYSVLEPYGAPLFQDNCGVDTSYSVGININTCSEGTLTRSWQATDPSGNGPVSCTQTIVVEHHSDWAVSFPADITAECQDATLPDFGEPVIFYDNCELIGLSHNDVVFETVPDACYKILRTWTAINWCLYDEYGSNVYAEYSEAQVGQDFDGDGDMDEHTFRDGANTAGTPDGYITFTQVIKVVDQEAPQFELQDMEVCIEGSNCFAEVSLPQPDISDCSTSLTTEITTDLPNPVAGDPYSYTDVPAGVYTATYAVSDDCGNTAFRQMTITVVDCKKPTPYCVDGLVLVFDQTGEITIWASDFDAGSFDNCPGTLSFSFSADTSDLSRTYFCEADQGIQPIELWVTDAAGNQDFCTTFVDLQDNLGVCDDLVVISGHIYTEEEEMVAHVRVEVNGGDYTDYTGTDGQYGFTQLPIGGDYTLTPMHDTLPGNGVSTLDMLYLQLHILQLQPLNSPYKLIAADVNNNGQISTLDLVYMQKLILGLLEEFPNNTSWRFVDADYIFPDSTNPWYEVFPEVLNYNNLEFDDLAADFIAVKVGDLNSSASTNLQGGNGVEMRSGELALLDVEEVRFRAGEEVQAFLRLPADEALRALQFTLHFDPEMLSFAGIPEGACLGADHVNTRFADSGRLSFAWADVQPSCRKGEALMGFTFRALQDGRLSEALSLSDELTPALAFGTDDLALRPVLRFRADEAGPQLFVGKVYPNPMRERAILPYYLDEPTTLILSVYDLSGRLLLREVREAEAGSGFFELEHLQRGAALSLSKGAALSGAGSASGLSKGAALSGAGSASSLSKGAVFLYRIESALGSFSGKVVVE